MRFALRGTSASRRRTFRSAALPSAVRVSRDVGRLRGDLLVRDAEARLFLLVEASAEAGFERPDDVVDAEVLAGLVVELAVEREPCGRVADVLGFLGI